jgi:PAS domain S-box-containing protein
MNNWLLQKEIFNHKLSNDATEHLFTQLAEFSHSGIVMMNEAGEITYANKKAEDILLLKKDDVTKKKYYNPELPVTDFNGNPFPVKEMPFPRVKKTGEPVGNIKYTVNLPDGKRTFLSVNAAPVYDDKNRLNAVITTIDDITDRVKTEVELAEQKKKSQQYLDIAETILLSINKDQIITLANRKCCLILEGEENEIIGKNWFDTFIEDEDREDVKAVFDMIISGKQETVEFCKNRIITLKGEEKFIEWHNSLLRDADNQITGVFCSGEDVTKILKQEEAKRSCIMLSTVLEKYGVDDIMKYGLEEGIKITGSKIGYFHFINPDQKTVSLQMWSGATHKQCSVPEKEEHYPIDKAGIWIDSVIQKEPVIHNNYSECPNKKGLPEGHVPIIRHLSVPVMENNKVVAIIGVGNKKYKYNQIDIEALQLIADMIWSVVRRKKAELSLKKQNDFLNNLLESLTHPFYVIDAKNYCIRLANSASHMDNQDNNEKCYRLTHNRNQPCDCKDHPCPLQIVKETKNPAIVEHKHFDNGKIKYFEIHGYPIFDDNGEVTQMIEYAIDITDRKKAQWELAESEAKLKSILRSAPIGIGLSMNNKLKWFNDELCRMTGYSKDELKNKSVKFLFPDNNEYKKIVKELYSDVKEYGTGTKEVKWKCKDGTIIDVLECATQFEGKGFVEGITFTALDITERNRAAGEKIKLEEQLFQAQKMESIGRLAGGVAHDFNNILTSIMGYSEILKIGLTDGNKTLEDAVEVIMSGVDKAAILTKQLLNFSRKGEFNPTIVNANSLMRNTIKVMEKIFEKNVNVKYDLDSDIAPIFVDKNQIEQVLTNIIINARDAMPNGGELYLSTENVFLDNNYVSIFTDLTGGHYIKISITDTGMGMPKEIRDRVFEPFFTTKAEGKGTGLGLATSYGIIKKHKGQINIYSEPGFGTTFSIYLPVSERTRNEAIETLHIQKGTGRLLVIDDEKAVRISLNNMLVRMGYEVDTATNGREGLQKFKEQKFDLVVLDIIMPEMNGKETFLKIREIDPDARVLLTSGYTRDIKASSLIEEGAAGFLQKPFRIQELSKSIAEILQQ